MTIWASRLHPPAALSFLLLLAAVAFAPLDAILADDLPSGPWRVVSGCAFDGPYVEQRGSLIQEGCANNWSWGRKDMLLEPGPGRDGAGQAQVIRIRGITSGGVQFSYTRLAIKKGHRYRVSFWLRSDGLEGPVRAYVRKGGYPWTVYLRDDWGWTGRPTAQWTQYCFTGTALEDVAEDVMVMFETSYLGELWIDDVVIEEADPAAAAGPQSAGETPAAGNLLPRSSCEGVRDPLWCGGVYGRAEAEWEDPQPYRAGGGKFGRFCMALPASTKGGSAFCRSSWVSVVPGRPYTFSAWLRSDEPGAVANLAVWYWGGEKALTGQSFPVTPQWQRFSVTATPEATPDNLVFLAISPMTGGTTVFADGLQFEATEAPTDYAPRYPLELYADVAQPGGHLFTWGETVPLTVLAAAAHQASARSAQVAITVTGYPDIELWRTVAEIPIGRPFRFPLRLQRNGLFRVFLRTLDAAQAAPQELLFATVPPPRPTGDRSMFGTHLTIRPFFVRTIKRLGINWTRFHDASVITKWGFAEARPGEYHWCDDIVREVRRAGLQILALPDWPPDWAMTKGEGAANVVDVDAFARYCERAARHYRGLISYWEIWNEPYMPGFFGGSAEQYGAVQEAGYRALKRGNPEATVIGPCADISQPGWVERIPPAQRRIVDGFSFHNYVTNLPGGGTLPFAGELAEHRALMGERRPSEYWCTEGTNGEIGANSFFSFLLATPDLNERATAYAARIWIENAKAGVCRHFEYQMHQTDTIMYYGRYSYKMLIGYDRSPTPAAVATAVTAWCIDGMRSVPVEAAPGLVQGLFTGDGRATWTVYDDGGVPGRRTLDLRRLPAGVRLLDVMGNDPRADGAAAWKIGPVPLFVVSESLTATELAGLCRGALSG